LFLKPDGGQSVYLGSKGTMLRSVDIVDHNGSAEIRGPSMGAGQSLSLLKRAGVAIFLFRRK